MTDLFARRSPHQHQPTERRYQATRVARVVSDAACLHMGVLAALAITQTTSVEWNTVLRLFPFSVIISVFILWIIEPMRLGSTSTNRVVSSLFIESSALMFLLMAFSRSAFGPVAAIIAMAIGVTLALAVRLAYRKLFPRSPMRIVAVMSNKPQARTDEQHLVQQLREAPADSLVLAHIVTDSDGEDFDDLSVDTMVLSPWLDPDRRVALSAKAHELGMRVRAIPSLYEIVLATAPTSELRDLFVLDIGFLRSAPVGFRLVKRLVDVTVSVVGLVVTAPIVAVLAVVIRSTSEGPVLYRQVRVGRNGVPFEMLKLRTMRHDAEDGVGAVLALADDSRITPVGRWLRTSRLDEIPQLLNILLGEMSLVGPRPERPEFVEGFSESIPGYDQRHMVRPGLTGLAQVRGSYASNAAAKLRYDLYYVRTPSVLFDVQIMAETVGAVMRRGSAEGTVSLVTADLTDELAAVVDAQPEAASNTEAASKTEATPKPVELIDVRVQQVTPSKASSAKLS